MAGIVRKLNIGCGPYPQAGYINIDINPRQKPDVVRDVRKGLPFDSDSADEILASHFLEHLTADEMLDLLEECYRVLKGGARMVILVPLREPYSLDHVRAFDERSFDPLEFPETPDYYQRAFRWRIVSKEEGRDKYFANLRVVIEAVK